MKDTNEASSSIDACSSSDIQAQGVKDAVSSMTKKTFLFSVIGIALLISVTIAPARDEKIELAQQKKTEPALDNSDVRWEGGFLGLLPRISERADQFEKQISSDDRKWLLNNVKHEDRFAICHVLLVLHWGPPSKDIEHSLGVWYGLSAKSETSGKPQYKLTERKKLYDIWKKALANPKSKNKYGETATLDPPFKRKQKTQKK